MGSAAEPALAFDGACDEIEKKIDGCQLSVQLKADPEWAASRLFVRMPTGDKQRHFLAGALSGPEMLTVPPHAFHRNEGQTILIIHVGNHVSGHPGIIHGGFLAALLDECLARCAFSVMSGKVGLTAELKISYKRPVVVEEYLVLTAQVTKIEGRKVWVTGSIQRLDDLQTPASALTPISPLAIAEALFVEAKADLQLDSHYATPC